MTDQERKVMEMALEALEAHADFGMKADKAIHALRQALAQDEQEPVIDRRLKVKIGRQYGYALNEHWFYLQPADEYAEQALTKHSGISAPPSKQEPVAWTKVSDGLPKSGVTVLACYRNSLGNLRRIRAHWIAAKTEESNGDYDEFFEYDEETDTYYAPEGWYECIDNWGDYSSVRVCEGEVTHWMPLPPAPDENNTAPPRKEWVGLDDEDWMNVPDFQKEGCELDAAIYDWIEARLKEKNT